MDHAYIGRGDGHCLLCGEWARRRWHVITECEVVKLLWQRLGLMVQPLGLNNTMDQREMAFGLTGNDKKTKLRNRLGFTLRSTVMSMRAIRSGDVDATVDRLWSIYLRRLKKELIEEWLCDKLNGSIVLFEARTLVAGLLGRLTEGNVEWSAIFDGVSYNYWDLFD